MHNMQVPDTFSRLANGRASVFVNIEHGAVRQVKGKWRIRRVGAEFNVVKADPGSAPGLNGVEVFFSVFEMKCILFQQAVEVFIASLTIIVWTVQRVLSFAVYSLTVTVLVSSTLLKRNII